MNIENIFVTFQCSAHIAGVKIGAVEQAVKRGRLQKITAMNTEGQAIQVLALTNLAAYFKWSDDIFAEIIAHHNIDLTRSGRSILSLPEEKQLPKGKGVLTMKFNE